MEKNIYLLHSAYPIYSRFTWQGGWWGTWGSGSGRVAGWPGLHGPAESCLSGAHDLEDTQNSETHGGICLVPSSFLGIQTVTFSFASNSCAVTQSKFIISSEFYIYLLMPSIILRQVFTTTKVTVPTPPIISSLLKWQLTHALNDLIAKIYHKWSHSPQPISVPY